MIRRLSTRVKPRRFMLFLFSETHLLRQWVAVTDRRKFLFCPSHRSKIPVVRVDSWNGRFEPSSFPSPGFCVGGLEIANSVTLRLIWIAGVQELRRSLRSLETNSRGHELTWWKESHVQPSPVTVLKNNLVLEKDIHRILFLTLFRSIDRPTQLSLPGFSFHFCKRLLRKFLLSETQGNCHRFICFFHERTRQQLMNKETVIVSFDWWSPTKWVQFIYYCYNLVFHEPSSS